MYRIIPAIMSGGAGTRLWPSSTDARPKQFHALTGGESLIVETAARVSGAFGALSFSAPIILCNVQHADMAEEQLRKAGHAAAAVVLEPVGRNTAATAAIAAALGAEQDAEALVLLLPADHVVEDRAAFLAAIERAAPFAKERIVTFGVTPNRPATGYGYIERGRPLADGVFEIASFREKPNEAVALGYLEKGGYSWNAGMFLFSPRVLLDEFEDAAEIRDGALMALQRAARDGARILLEAEAFAAAPALPLDIAVMEKTKRGAVAPCEIGWADVGSWDEIWRISGRDSDGNALQGPVVALDAHNNLLRSEGVTICVAGVDDLAVIATGEAVVIVPRERAQDVKLLRELAEKLKR
ncbi:MAG TPA: sugar phosphate nucleotidyltransferase [Caulobacterales bacterium]|nr:sugar phosphate nucleotidyltransferase [Caulobacterales bacterium]